MYINKVHDTLGIEGLAAIPSTGTVIPAGDQSRGRGEPEPVEEED